MDLKTKRTIICTIKNTAIILFFGGIGVSYMLACLYFSNKFTGDLYFGFAAIALPFLFYTVWDYSKQQVENELRSEEELVNTLTKQYER